MSVYAAGVASPLHEIFKLRNALINFITFLSTWKHYGWSFSTPTLLFALDYFL